MFPILNLLRIKHYIKNLLVLIPLFFSLSFLDYEDNIATFIGFLSFCILASIVYIFNDIQDVEEDKKHSTKSSRPLASGKVTLKIAIFLMVALLLILLILQLLLFRFYHHQTTTASFLILVVYLLVNIGYSLGLKDIPVVDVLILASGFIIRVIYGAFIINVGISSWLYLTIMMGAFYLGFGKRRNEIVREGHNTRTVLKYYNHNFLDKNMYMCQALSLVFYALWSIDPVTKERLGSEWFIFTIPFVLLIFLKYNLNLETDSDGDPTSIILQDKTLLSLIFLYVLISISILIIGKGIIKF